MQQLLVSDANILIDMEEGELLDKMFQLPYEFMTPDILYFEELEEDHPHILKLGLVLKEVSSESMVYAMQLTHTYVKASRNDCFALALARQESCPLLTGDRALRLAAEKETTTVQGSIWVIRQMIVHQIITPEDARQALKKMKANGRRLPWMIAEAAINELQKGLS